MESSSKREFIIGIIIIVVIAAFFGWRYYDRQTRPLDAFRPWSADALPSVQGGTREKLTFNIKTPNSTSSADVPAGVAVPVAIDSYGATAKRNFTLNGKNNKYEPNLIVVNEGDTIDMEFRAVDDNYDFFIPDFGVYKKILKGETGRVMFQAPSYGQYEFFCKNLCMGRDKVSGILLVNQNN